MLTKVIAIALPVRYLALMFGVSRFFRWFSLLVHFLGQKMKMKKEVV
jgi:hypothetical protein